MGLFDFIKRQLTTDEQPVTSDSSSTPVIGVSNPYEFNKFIFQDAYVPLNKHPDVIIAVDRIADMVSNMTIHLMQSTEKGDVRIKNALSRKIDIEPCQFMTRKSWIYRIVRDLLLDGDGNSLVHISYDAKNDLIKNLTPLPMQDVQYFATKDGYKVTVGDVTYKPDELIHFVINPDTRYHWKGTGYRVQLAEIVNNLSQATKTKRDFLKSKNMPSLIIKVDALNEDLASPTGRQKVLEKYIETENAGEPWVIPADLMEVVQVKPLSLQDIAINESVAIDKKTVAGILGVPPFFLGVGDFNKDSFNNWVNTRVMSIASVIAQTLTRDILISEELYFKFNPRSLYSYSLTELVNAGSQLVKINSMRRNELRDWIGLTPDEEMEELIVLENFIPQDKLGDQNKLNGGEYTEKT